VAAGVVGSTALAVALSSGPTAVAAEGGINGREGVPADASPVRGDIGGVSPGRQAATATPQTAEAATPQKTSGLERSTGKRAPSDLAPRLFAQFQLPAPEKEGEAPILNLPKHLTYQYFVGVDPEMVWRKNTGLDGRLPDKSITWLPSTSGIFTYRPTNWLETTVELQMEKEFVVHQENPQRLPGGIVEFPPPRHSSLLVDQFHFVFREFTAPFEISVGRKGFEDERRSLLDGSIDAVSISLREGRFTGLALFGRNVRWNWDLARHSRQTLDVNNTYYTYGDYRVSDDLKLAGYGIVRDDKSRQEGRPITIGMRAFGTPSVEVNYWADIAVQGGRDELWKQIRAQQYDFGVTRRFFGIPLIPNFTLGWAMGTGDDNPNKNVNNAFKPTGLGSNERKFAGVPQFLVFGETFDPDLSNVKILTVGFGIRPDPQFSVDLVWHGYQLHKQNGTLRSSLTVDPNTVSSASSKDLGTEWDFVVGFRNFLGVRRLTVNLRAGWFFPGKAFRTNDGTGTAPILRNPDNASSGIVIVEYRFL
jgi:alginate production protein